MAEFDRLEALEEIKLKLGFEERKEDEYTAKEIEKCFGIKPTSLVRFFEKEEVKYSRRKATADGRRQYVYRFML